jgi:cyanophycin synthetase
MTYQANHIMINITPIATFLGPNIYATEPVVVAKLEADVEILQDSERRIKLLSSLCRNWFNFKNSNSTNTLEDLGDFLSQWAQAILNQTAGEIHTARVENINNSVTIILGHYHPKSTYDALVLGIKLFTEVDRLKPEELVKYLKDFWQAAITFHPDFQAKILIDYSEKNGIPYRPYIMGTRTWQYGWGERSVILFESSPQNDSAMGARWSSDKMLSKQIFSRLGAPIAPSVITKNENDLPRAASYIGFPCVTKPLFGSRSVGVTTYIRNTTELLSGFKHAQQNSSSEVMIEKHIEGEVHRIMIMQGKFWRAIKRNRPFITGDGQSSIRQLAEKLIATFPSTKTPKDFIGPPLLDQEFYQSLNEQGFNENSISPVGIKIYIRKIPLLSTGATYEDVTANIHPDVRLMSESLAHNFGIVNCGIDYITQDISQPCIGHGVFLEINLTPGLRVPLMAGVSLDEIGSAVLGSKPDRLPVTLIVSSEKNFAELKKNLPRSPGTGWIVGNSSGIDSFELPLSSEPHSFNAFDTIVRQPTLKRIFLVCSHHEIEKYGLVTKFISKTFLLKDSPVSKAWTALIQSLSDQFIKVDDIPNLLVEIK